MRMIVNKKKKTIIMNDLLDIAQIHLMSNSNISTIKKILVI